jgi:hypothetical protein
MSQQKVMNEILHHVRNHILIVKGLLLEHKVSPNIYAELFKLLDEESQCCVENIKKEMINEH